MGTCAWFSGDCWKRQWKFRWTVCALHRKASSDPGCSWNPGHGLLWRGRRAWPSEHSPTTLLLMFDCYFNCFAITCCAQISEVLMDINSILSDPDCGGGPLGQHGQVLAFHLLEACRSKRQLMDMLLHRFIDLCQDIDCLLPINMMLRNPEVSYMYFNFLLIISNLLLSMWTLSYSKGESRDMTIPGFVHCVFENRKEEREIYNDIKRALIALHRNKGTQPKHYQKLMSLAVNWWIPSLLHSLVFSMICMVYAQ